MSEKTEQVVEGEFTEVKEPTQEKEILCGMSIVMTEDEGVSVHIHGTNQNLVFLDGLLKYAERYMDNTWKSRIGSGE